MTSTHVTKLDSAKACSALCVKSSVSANCDVFAWKKGTCHVGETSLDDQTVVSGTTLADGYQVYVMKGLLPDSDFYFLKAVPKANWGKGLIMPPQAAASAYDCKLVCMLAFAASCFGFTYDHLDKSCYIIDVTKTDGDASMATKDLHDVYLIKDYAEKKGCPEGYTLGAGKCYHVSDGIYTGWDCNGYCALHDGYLAEPKDAAEQVAIAGLSTHNAYLGFANVNGDGATFNQFTTGNIISYQGFANTYPQEQSGCVYQEGGNEWKDVECHVLYNCYCEAKINNDIHLFASLAHYAVLDNIPAEFWTKWVEIEIKVANLKTCLAHCYIRDRCWTVAFVASKKLCYIGDVRMKKKARQMRKTWTSSEAAKVYTKAGEDVDLNQKKIVQSAPAKEPLAPAENVLKFSPVDLKYGNYEFMSNYFMADNDYVGDLVTYDLGGYVEIERIFVKSSTNYKHGSRALEEFFVESSLDNVAWTWIRREFYDTIDATDVQKSRFFPIETKDSMPYTKSLMFPHDGRPHIGRYIKIHVLSSQGIGPAVQYFDVKIGK